MLHYCYRQIHIPLFFYFQRRWHIFVGTVMAGISITIFFGLAYILIWELEPPDAATIKIGFWTMVGFILWLVVSNSLALLLRPPRLQRKCQRLMDKIKQRISEREARAWDTLKDFEKFNPKT